MPSVPLHKSLKIKIYKGNKRIVYVLNHHKHLKLFTKV